MKFDQKYVEMCSQATEIQAIKIEDNEDFTFYEGNLFVNNKQQEFYSVALYEGFYSASCIWIPRQEDLQNIIIDDYKSYMFPAYAMLEQMHDYAKKVYDFYSFEMIWLCFVMKKKYNKVWDKESLIWV